MNAIDRISNIHDNPTDNPNINMMDVIIRGMGGIIDSHRSMTHLKRRAKNLLMSLFSLRPAG